MRQPRTFFARGSRRGSGRLAGGAWGPGLVAERRRAEAVPVVPLPSSLVFLPKPRSFEPRFENATFTNLANPIFESHFNGSANQFTSSWFAFSSRLIWWIVELMLKAALLLTIWLQVREGITPGELCGHVRGRPARPGALLL